MSVEEYPGIENAGEYGEESKMKGRKFQKKHSKHSKRGGKRKGRRRGGR
jgi:hypothetical protein